MVFPTVKVRGAVELLCEQKVAHSVLAPSACSSMNSVHLQACQEMKGSQPISQRHSFSESNTLSVTLILFIFVAMVGKSKSRLGFSVAHFSENKYLIRKSWIEV